MRLQDNIRKCYYEFDRQRGCILRKDNCDVFLGKRIVTNGRAIPVYVLEYKNVQSLGVMAMKDVLKRQLNSPELLRVYSLIESRDSITGKYNAYGILEYVDGVTLDRFVVGDIQGCSTVAKTNIMNLFSDYSDNREGFATKVILELANVVEILNNNGFSIANLEPSSIIVSSSGTIKLLDYGMPVGQITISHETASLGRMLHYLMTGSEYTGSPKKIESSPIRTIVGRSLSNKYTSVQAFRDAFKKKDNWWKYLFGIVIGILLVMAIILGMTKINMGDESTVDDYSSGNSESYQEMPSEKESPVISESNSDETDFAGGLKKLKPVQKHKKIKKDESILNNDDSNTSESTKAESITVKKKKEKSKEESQDESSERVKVVF